jgi:hypothetical protein
LIRCDAGHLADALRQVMLPEGALVFVTKANVTDDWEKVSGELMEAFTLSQEAARSGGPVVYVVDGDDLLGRGGRGPAMVACGLLSAARTLALETAKSGRPVNVVALGDRDSPDLVGLWVEILCRPGGPSGELIRLGGDHLGKALP